MLDFLARLNREIDDVKGRSLDCQPLPSTQEMFSKVRHEKKRRTVMLHEIGDDSNGASLALITRGITNGLDNSNEPVGRERLDSNHGLANSNMYNSSGLSGPMQNN